MNFKEMKERNFSADLTGLIYDDAGNEYRNENGNIEYLLEGDEK